MKKVITYGTYDLLHYGHIRLLERAKALGDYLIVGVTSDDYDRVRGKINNQQSLMERIEAIRKTGLADEIIVEEYDGQKIDDIKKYNIDIFTLGSDWKGKFDYLNEFCEVVYLDRTEGISSTEIRKEKRKTSMVIYGGTNIENKFRYESSFVNGVEIRDDDFDSAYIFSRPEKHYDEIKKLLENKKSVLVESPICLSKNGCKELFDIAKNNNCLLFDGIKTAYSTAFQRLCLLVKSGKIGDVVSIDVTCTSMADFINDDNLDDKWNSICAWGPTALLPIFEILGVEYLEKRIISKYLNKEKKFDGFTKIDFVYNNATASIKVGKGAKSEGEMIITGTKGYVYVPAPWWKTEYFEIRYENSNENKKYFYQLDGEGIRYEIASFIKSVSTSNNFTQISEKISVAICEIMEDFFSGKIIEI